MQHDCNILNVKNQASALWRVTFPPPQTNNRPLSYFSNGGFSISPHGIATWIGARHLLVESSITKTCAIVWRHYQVLIFGRHSKKSRVGNTCQTNTKTCRTNVEQYTTHIQNMYRTCPTHVQHMSKRIRDVVIFVEPLNIKITSCSKFRNMQHTKCVYSFSKMY